MAVELVDVHRGAYADSVQLMSATRGMREQEGVGWAAALMGTPANLEVLAAEGFGDAGLGEATAGDVVMAVRAQSGDQARQALGFDDRREERLVGALRHLDQCHASLAVSHDEPRKLISQAC